jgi:hypothetical protein
MIVNVHVDCDPLWVYATEYGVAPDFENADVYQEAGGRFLELLTEFGIPATFFIIGRDLLLPGCAQFAREAVRAGHEIGNHTLSHLQDLHSVAPEQRLSEISECHDLVREKLGFVCTGLRMPGYYFDEEIARYLRKLGYSYDTSTLPGCGVHVMSAAYRLLNPSGRAKRFGRWWYLFAKRDPHEILPGCWEMPITTFPLFGLPLHSTFIFQFGTRYFDLGFRLSRALRGHMVYLFHLIDLMDERAAGGLRDKVAVLQQPLARRIEITRHLLAAIATQQVSTTCNAVARLAGGR